MSSSPPCLSPATDPATGGGPAAGGERPGAASPVLRLHGAASVVDGLVRPHAAAVEEATGIRLVVDRSNAGRGLKDLVEGRCDLALASASLEATLDAARTAGLTAPAAELQLHVAATSEVVFVVHPSNPVRRLSREQLRDIHTGRLSRWKDVGGLDRPIAVITDAAASATRALVRQLVLGGAEYAPGARAVAAVAQVNDEVAGNPAAIGSLGRELADTSRVVVVEAERLERPLAFVSVGRPGADAARVIEAFRSRARR